MPELSVIIPTYNRVETLRHVVPSLLAQDVAPDTYEILVCDSDSSDSTAEFLAALRVEHPSVRHLPGAYSGRAMARNAGIAAASGEVVLFNDADILASEDLVRRHLERHRARRRLAVVGWEVQVRSYDEYLEKRDRPERRGALHPPTRKHLSWLYFLTGNASVRREDLLRVGSFDEGFTGYGHEDLELGFRLQRAGIDIVYEPGAVNYHWQDVPYEDQREKMRLAGHSAVRFYRKHKDVSVLLNLGMTPVSRGAHTLLSSLPTVLGYFDTRAPRSPFARRLIEQYYYVGGIKEAMAAGGHA
ncbi:MAG TPA: glycosyltransferase [Candidatus Dormibacteraeota bacterium]|nr:glycosyltransferase [Candidatus Dormibacteraeota bacterium]